jgi:biopolymer transport protein ExbD
MRNCHGSSSPEIKSEMNVVPLIDVMLVLLIVFMVASPMITSSLDIKLPTTGSPQEVTKKNSESTVVVSLKTNGDMYLSNTAIGVIDELKDPKQLVLILTTLKEQQPNSRLYLRADKGTPYERVVFGLELIKTSGFDDVNLVTEARS